MWLCRHHRETALLPWTFHPTGYEKFRPLAIAGAIPPGGQQE
jgi:hypothetical protein